MNAPLIIQDVFSSLRRRYGKAISFGRSRRFQFGTAFTCSINYSKLLSGHKYFFGLARDVVEASSAYPETQFGDLVLLVCGSADNILVLPRPLIITMMQGVSSRRVDIFCENGSYILQTTRHPKLDVSEYFNAFPKRKSVGDEASEDSSETETTDRLHVKMQWALIQLGRAEGCSVWVPPNDRNLSYRRQPFASYTMERLPSFGFNENTRRIIQNIDILWLTKNVILKAFEVESTTVIYSGLLRLNDLVLSQPNNQIDLYIVASRTRRERVYNQLLRPSFQPLMPRCEFVAFDAIEEQMTRLEGFPLDAGARVSGLIRGERFAVPEHYVYPSGV